MTDQYNREEGDPAAAAAATNTARSLSPEESSVQYFPRQPSGLAAAAHPSTPPPSAPTVTTTTTTTTDTNTGASAHPSYSRPAKLFFYPHPQGVRLDTATASSSNRPTALPPPHTSAYPGTSRPHENDWNTTRREEEKGEGANLPSASTLAKGEGPPPLLAPPPPLPVMEPSTVSAHYPTVKSEEGYPLGEEKEPGTPTADDERLSPTDREEGAPLAQTVGTGFPFHFATYSPFGPEGGNRDPTEANAPRPPPPLTLSPDQIQHSFDATTSPAWDPSVVLRRLRIESESDLFEGDFDILRCCCCRSSNDRHQDSRIRYPRVGGRQGSFSPSSFYRNENSREVGEEEDALLSGVLDVLDYETERARSRGRSGEPFRGNRMGDSVNNNNNSFVSFRNNDSWGSGTSIDQRGCWNALKRNVKHNWEDFVSFLSIRSNHLKRRDDGLPGNFYGSAKLFCLLNYIAAAATLLAIVLITAQVALSDYYAARNGQSRHVEIQDTTVCQSFTYQNQRLDLIFTLVSFLLNVFFLIWFAFRAAKYEKTAFLYGYVVVMALQVIRVVYFLYQVAPRYLSPEKGGNWFLLKGNYVLLVFSGVTLLLTLPVAVYLQCFVFGWRTFYQGITHLFIINLKKRYARLQTLLQLDVVLSLNIVLAIAFLIDSISYHILNAVSLLGVVVATSVILPWLRWSSHSRPPPLPASSVSGRGATLEESITTATDRRRSSNRRNTSMEREAPAAATTESGSRKTGRRCESFGWYPIVVLLLGYLLCLSFHLNILSVSWREYRIGIALRKEENAAAMVAVVEEGAVADDPTHPSREMAVQSYCYGKGLSQCLLRHSVFIVNAKEYDTDDDDDDHHSSSSCSSSSSSSAEEDGVPVQDLFCFHLSNGTHTFLPTHSILEEYFQVKDCDRMCYEKAGGDAFYRGSVIAGCCEQYGECRQKYQFRSSTVLLLLVLIGVQFVVRFATIRALVHRYIGNDDGVVFSLLRRI